mmetsp:Transcript_16551/g.18721  ORF Transcript_16551/g.18721 Transcript_16551/m.18721 type:complete len:388 (-) Transcript_16551:1884-3047(-)
MGALEDEKARKSRKPKFTVDTVLSFCESIFGVRVEKSDLKVLDSYDDQNFYVKGVSISETDAFSSASKETQKYLLKIHNGVEYDNIRFIEAQNSVLQHLSSNGFNVSVPQKTQSKFPNDFYGIVNDKCVCLTNVSDVSNEIEEQRYVVRLLSWVEGEILHNMEITSDMLIDSGIYLAKLRECLNSFKHDGATREHLWDLASLPLIVSMVKYIDDVAVRAVVEDVIETYKNDVVPQQGLLAKGVLQSDFNDSNILMDPSTKKVCGVIDFGDMVHSSTIFDLAISMAYSMIKPIAGKKGYETASNLLEGYCKLQSLTALELKLLRTLVACRLAASITLGALSIHEDPTNEYLRRHAQPARNALIQFWSEDPKLVNETFAQASKVDVIKN